MKKSKWITFLMAVVLLCGYITACGNRKDDKADSQSKTDSNDPETIAQAFAKAVEETDFATQINLSLFDIEEAMRQDLFSPYDDEKELFADLSEEYDQEISNWKDVYAAVHTDSKASLAEQYGSDYSILTEVVDCKTLSAEELQNLKNDWLDDELEYMDADVIQAVSTGMLIQLNVTIKGAEDEYTEMETVTMAKHDGRWKVAAYTYGSPVYPPDRQS